MECCSSWLEGPRLRSFSGSRSCPSAIRRTTRINCLGWHPVTGSLVVCAGGCEYRGTELETLCQRYELKCLGPKPQQMSILRDRSNWRAWCTSADIRYPATYHVDTGETLQSCLSRHGMVHRDQSAWIWKPIRSGGGLGIVDLDPTSPVPGAGIIQQRIEGQSLA